MKNPIPKHGVREIIKTAKSGPILKSIILALTVCVTVSASKPIPVVVDVNLHRAVVKSSQLDSDEAADTLVVIVPVFKYVPIIYDHPFSNFTIECSETINGIWRDAVEGKDYNREMIDETNWNICPVSGVYSMCYRVKELP